MLICLSTLYSELLIAYYVLSYFNFTLLWKIIITITLYKIFSNYKYNALWLNGQL